MSTTKTRARVESVQDRGCWTLKTRLHCVSTLLTDDGCRAEVVGELSRDVEYDVTITVKPRRWAPQECEWHDDDLHLMYSDGTGFRFSLCTAVNRLGRAIKVFDERGVERLCGVPAEVFRAFEKAGLL